MIGVVRRRDFEEVSIPSSGHVCAGVRWNKTTIPPSSGVPTTEFVVQSGAPLGPKGRCVIYYVVYMCAQKERYELNRK